jgi:NADH-quinone oxidoreductase subunit L
MEKVYLAIVLLPLLGAAVAGLGCRVIPRAVAHSVTIAGVAISFLLSLVVLHDVLTNGTVYNGTVYTWATIGSLHLEVGFLVDSLTALMMAVVTSVSLLVHIYTIGYMHDDPGYNRFFSYISLFTFSMLMLVMSNNFLQLFFGWEAVGLVSYLLIGFWFKRPTAIFANLKAFLVNRVGDFGFLLGIGLILMYAGSLDYATVFGLAPELAQQSVSLLEGHNWELLTVACLLLFVGAMGKSAQVPLHVWLPDSMEGPTPISALIHAATMVTAGVFMVARMSPLFEYSDVALNTVMFIGMLTAFFMGLIGLVQNDIKRVVAYSTLSQLGYMTVALGASAYSVAIFHLMTHAFFKALLFLAAGSVIIGMHHEQDMQKMGGLKKYMPVTYWTSVIGTLALVGFPGFAGYYSKDMIIEAVGASNLPAAGITYYAVLFGVLITSLYSFRLLFLAFHGKYRGDPHHHPHESPAVVTGPLIALAVPSVIIGALTAGSVAVGGYFADSIFVLPQHEAVAHLGEAYHGAFAFALHAVVNPAFYLMLAGAGIAWYLYIANPAVPGTLARRFRVIYNILLYKYGFDEAYQFLFAGGTRKLAQRLWQWGDVTLVDGWIVNGSAKLVGFMAGKVRKLQTGYLYHYAFTMILGLLLLLAWAVMAGWPLW